MKLAELTVTGFADIVSSDAPAPGGGSCAALYGAIGAALTAMVGGLTQGRKKYAEYAEHAAEVEAKEKVFTALSDEVNSELDVKWSEMKSYDEGGGSYLFLLLLLAMVALACFNIWRKLRKKTRNQY